MNTEAPIEPELPFEIEQTPLEPTIKEKWFVTHKKRIFKIFKPIAYLIGIMLILNMASRFIDINKYKPDIELLVLELTGKTLIIQGNLSHHYFPKFHISAENVILKDKALAKTEILTIGNLKISPTLSLLWGKSDFDLDLSDLKLNKYLFSFVKTRFSETLGVFNFQKTQAGFIAGQEHGLIEIDKISIDSNGDIPKYHIKHEGDAHSLPVLLKMLGFKDLITGKTRLKIDLTAEGKSLIAAKKTLSGLIDIEIFHGKFHGVDLIASLQEAKSVLSTLSSGITKVFSSAVKALITKNKHLTSEKTPFDSLKISGTVKNGVLNNPVFNIKHSHYDIQGEGKINLIQGVADYRLNAIYKDVSKQKLTHHIAKSAPLIVYVSGPLEKLHIKTDLESYLKYVKK